MKSFLDSIIETIQKDKENDYHNTLVIFPSRRAAHIFKKKFASYSSNVYLLPAVYSITDLYDYFSDFRILSSMELLLNLYVCQLELGRNEELSSFYDWGSILLKDFNDIDKSLINHSIIFNHIEAWKETGEFLQNDEYLQELKNFWNAITGNEEAELNKEFLQNWKFIPTLYHTFRKRLIQKNCGYEGMIQKEVVQKLEANPSLISWNTIYVCGFNKLENTEQKLFELFKTHRQTHFIFDYDIAYLDKHQAGYHLRRNPFFKSNPDAKSSFENKKKIDLHQAPLITGTARIAGEILTELIRNKAMGSMHETLVVMPDESLLLPFLKSIPDELESFNVTVGYPIHLSLWFEFCQLLFKRYFKPDQNDDYKTITISDIINHPILQSISENSEISTHELLDKLSLTSNSAIEVLQLSVNTLQEIREIFATTSAHDGLHATDKIILDACISELQEMTYLFSSYPDWSTGDLFLRMTMNHLKNHRISFTGEPVQGLQITGLLESRCLDYTNVIVLSMNEGTLPSGHRYDSYIPYHIRKVFKLSLPEDLEAGEAYYFYRLIQRAENVHLIYCSDSGAMGTKEVSRFVLQILYELKDQFKDIETRHFIAESENVLYTSEEIIIEKNEAILNRLDGICKNGFSPSSISKFIHCPLQFYFSYILKLSEPEEEQEEIDSRTLGNILHYTMEDIYKSKAGTLISKDEIAQEVKKIPDYVNTNCQRVLEQNYNQSGRNKIVASIIESFVENILKVDQSVAPFRMEAVESEYRFELALDQNKKAVVKCRIDRIDLIKGRYRILDYKTGSVKFNKINLEKIFFNSYHRITLQLLLSAFLFAKEKNVPMDDLDIGVVRMQTKQQMFYFLNTEGYQDLDVLIENELGDIINMILDPLQAFYQTENVSKCKYCSYKQVCNRG